MVVTRSGINQAQKLTRPRKLRASETLSVSLASDTAFTFSPVGPIPFSDSTCLMKVILGILNSHLSGLTVRPLSFNL